MEAKFSFTTVIWGVAPKPGLSFFLDLFGSVLVGWSPNLGKWFPIALSRVPRSPGPVVRLQRAHERRGGSQRSRAERVST